MAVVVHVFKGQGTLAFRSLKRKLIDIGLSNELRQRLVYEKPTEERQRVEHEAIRRAKRRQLQRNLRFIFSRMARGF
ncbi:hypothetical protein CCYA_CCYA02G0581 [Cyanidiococcus yangmingshanensis]|nr:hypothetical protein CCYA_CCYA02G0581 [Cyanidiococcus yangmingshanensis]